MKNKDEQYMETVERTPLIAPPQNDSLKETLIIILISFILFVAAIGIIAWLAVDIQSDVTPSPPYNPPYNSTFNRSYITSPDGIKMALSITTPIPKDENEKFPVIFSYTPYRKDATSFIFDGEMNNYFPQYGFIVCVADIRGTGSSEGNRPDREYSDQEMEDAKYIIRWLATEYKLSNGNIGMWGMSWSAINSLILSMEHTPYLKSIFIFHASDDLYYNDVHYINGVKHIDYYQLTIDHLNTLPLASNSPMILDEEYYVNRFDQSPWILTYFTEQNDGAFWRDKSAVFGTDKLIESGVSFYLWAGQLEGQRDYAMNLYQAMYGTSSSCKIVMGPWDHEYPSDSTTTPRVEWKHEAVRWFNQWLRDEIDNINNTILDEPDISIYVRYYNPPSDDITDIPGEWRTYNSWPETTEYKLYLTDNHQLTENIDDADTVIHDLLYRSVTGTQIPVWWGSTNGNMYEYDQYSLVYDSEILTEMIEIIGKVSISLIVKTSANLANWIVRLEDFNPLTNESVLITGSNRNGAQRESRMDPSFIPNDEWFVLRFDLLFTTWQFPIGHQIRIAITNALYPMLWPSKYKMNTSLNINNIETFIILPISTDIENEEEPSFVSDEIQVQYANNGCFYLGNPDNLTLNGWITNITFDDNNNMNAKISDDSYFCSFVENTNICLYYRYSMESNEDNPAINRIESFVRSYLLFQYPVPNILTLFGNPICILPPNENETVEPPNNPLNGRDHSLDLWTSTIIISDENNFHVNVNRTLYQNGMFQETKIFTQQIPRIFQ